MKLSRALEWGNPSPGDGHRGKMVTYLLFLLLFLTLRLSLRYKDIAQGERDNQIGQVTHKLRNSFQGSNLSLLNFECLENVIPRLGYVRNCDFLT